MSKTRVSKVRNEIQAELGVELSYHKIADMCRQLNIAFKPHDEMGIHYNSVIAESDANRLINSFRHQLSGKSAPPKAQASEQPRQAPRSSSPAQQTGARPVRTPDSYNRPTPMRHLQREPDRPSEQRQHSSGGARPETSQRNDYQARPAQRPQEQRYSGGQNRPPSQRPSGGAAPGRGGASSAPRSGAAP